MNPSIKSTGFGSNVAVVELHFCIVQGHYGFSVYLRHGAPARADWYSAYTPIFEGKYLEDAQSWIDTVAGIKDAHKSFPVITRY